jgi:hypothetical protein
LQNHTKKRNKLTAERLNQLVFVQYNVKMNGKKQKAKKNNKMDPLVAADATHAQGWMVEGGDDEIDVEPVAGLTWKLIEEACGTDEVAKLRRSSRLAQMRNVDEDIIEEPEPEPEEEPLHDDDEEIEFESDQEDVVSIAGVGEQEGDEDDQ